MLKIPVSGLCGERSAAMGEEGGKKPRDRVLLRGLPRLISPVASQRRLASLSVSALHCPKSPEPVAAAASLSRRRKFFTCAERLRLGLKRRPCGASTLLEAAVLLLRASSSPRVGGQHSGRRGLGRGLASARARETPGGSERVRAPRSVQPATLQP